MVVIAHPICSSVRLCEAALFILYTHIAAVHCSYPVPRPYDSHSSPPHMLSIYIGAHLPTRRNFSESSTVISPTLFSYISLWSRFFIRSVSLAVRIALVQSHSPNKTEIASASSLCRQCTGSAYGTQFDLFECVSESCSPMQHPAEEAAHEAHPNH